ncbi:hypothetical protein FRC98_07090 [Lujinxingia vulgaris]|uniref:Uncharacterized protein n=1 Tax=Lujinxingia vulgaris TaxID=2600176 RepID=A0A5C6XH23_9DELT|nr:hypothetical protein [Lujinxingia vulgaris]TXD37452.1 hypothetical protein FRC98_07090 [Lujinxingia vulgaris]
MVVNIRARAIAILREVERFDDVDEEELLSRLQALVPGLSEDGGELTETLQTLITRLEMMHFQLCAAQRPEALRHELRQALARLQAMTSP